MNVKSFLRNKYMLLAIILLSLVTLDMVMHKGITRVLLPKSFPVEKKAGFYKICDAANLPVDKRWRKAVNTLDKIRELDTEIAGFEMDVYFDTTKSCLYVYHDTSEYSTLRIESILDVYASKKMQGFIWLDFKNLDSSNAAASLQYIAALRDMYGLQGKILVESPSLQNLSSFCEQGFFTSYYVPFFNPYRISDNVISSWVDSIRNGLEKYKVSALSGYYFQYPVLKNYFPMYPILTWADNPGLSLVANAFEIRLFNDPHVKIVLNPR